MFLASPCNSSGCFSPNKSSFNQFYVAMHSISEKHTIANLNTQFSQLLGYVVIKLELRKEKHVHWSYENYNMYMLIFHIQIPLPEEIYFSITAFHETIPSWECHETGIVLTLIEMMGEISFRKTHMMFIFSDLFWWFLLLKLY